MNLQLTSSGLAFALSANAVGGHKHGDIDIDSNVVSVTNRVNASYRNQKDASGQRRAADSPIASNSVGRVPRRGSDKKGTDVGLLGGGLFANRRLLGKQRRFRKRQRSLQGLSNQVTEDTDTDTCLKPDTCEPALCECSAGGGTEYECAAELNAVCNGITADDGTVFTVDGCVPDGYASYYNTLFCPFAKCVVNGGGYGECGCEFYTQSCDLYKDDPRYADDEDVMEHCAGAACCKARTDEVGKTQCLEDGPTSMPSAMPSAPTTSPTTGTPTVTISPTVSPKPTSGPTKVAVAVVTPPAADSGIIGAGDPAPNGIAPVGDSTPLAPAGDGTPIAAPTDAPPTGDGVGDVATAPVATPAAPAPSGAQSLMSRSAVGAASVAAAAAWCMFV